MSFELGGSDFDWLLVNWLCDKIHMDVDKAKADKTLFESIMKKVEEVKSAFNMNGMDDMDIELENLNGDSSEEEDPIRVEYDDFCQQLKGVVDTFQQKIRDFIISLPPLSRCEITGCGIRNRELQRVLLETIQARNPQIISFFLSHCSFPSLSTRC